MPRWTRGPGEPYAEVALGGPEDADRAVAAARRAIARAAAANLVPVSLELGGKGAFFVRDLRAPFGGVGDSGIGREGGTFSREFFTEPKAVVMQV